VNAYFSLLGQHLGNPQEPVSSLARKVCKEAGYEGNIETMAGWIRENKIPRDVRIAVTNGYPIPSRLADAYAQLRKCRPELDHWARARVPLT
jgi:CO/xanthine dehydrogenase FAD-binding subunit